jgi:hypothetical protein
MGVNSVRPWSHDVESECAGSGDDGQVAEAFQQLRSSVDKQEG